VFGDELVWLKERRAITMTIFAEDHLTETCDWAAEVTCSMQGDGSGFVVPLQEAARIGGEITWVLLPVFVLLVLVSHRRRPLGTLVLVARLALSVYLCRLLAVVYFPWPNPFEPSPFQNLPDVGILEANNFTPFKTVRGTWPDSFVRQIGGNLVMLFPLGVLAPMAFEWLRVRTRLISSVVTAAAVIEGGQLLIRHRTFDIDDLWLNALGGVAGAVLWFVMQPRFERPHQRLGAVRRTSKKMR